MICVEVSWPDGAPLPVPCQPVNIQTPSSPSSRTEGNGRVFTCLVLDCLSGHDLKQVGTFERSMSIVCS